MYIKNFKSHKAEYDNKAKSLNQNYIKFNNEVNKFNNEKDLFKFEKNLFYNINFLLNTGKIMNNIHSTEEKISDANNKLSANNVTTQPNTTAVTASSGSIHINKNSNPSFSKTSKKNIYYEKPENLMYSNNRDKSNRGSVDFQNQTNNGLLEKGNLTKNITQNNYNSNQITTDGYNTVSNVSI